jgi:hypothetical protein
MIKPSIAHFAFAAALVNRGPPATDHRSGLRRVDSRLGNAWAALMLSFGVTNINIDAYLGVAAWARFISLATIGAMLSSWCRSIRQSARVL